MQAQTTRPPRQDTRTRHHWGIHVSEADDKALAQFQIYAFHNGILKENTKHAVVRYALTRLLDASKKLHEQDRPMTSPAPTPQSLSLPDPVVTVLQTQLSQTQARVNAAKGHATGVSQ